MDKFVINGGKKLQGEVEIRGSKNAAFPILAATLLTKEPCIIDNMPLIEDVFRMIEILQVMGAKVEWLGERKIKITCKDIDPAKLDQKTVSRFRGSVLLFAPLIARFGSLKAVAPGGCIIGARPLDTHFDAFSQLGIENSQKGKFYYFKKKKEDKEILERDVILDEFSVTATENVLLSAAAQKGKTVLKIADQDYQVQELAKVLNKMGARIRLTGAHIFEITGSEKLKGFSHKLLADPIEAGTFIITALITKGDVLIRNAEPHHLALFLKKLKKAGAKIEVLQDGSVHVMPSDKIIIETIQSWLYPGIHSDLQPSFGVLATQTKGSTLIHDPLYPGRLKYLEELNKMGAEIIFCDPHRAIVNGPTVLHGIEVPSSDLRGGAAFVMAGLIARGTTIINNIYQIDRGYEKIEERLQKLGADIKRVKE